MKQAFDPKGRHVGIRIWLSLMMAVFLAAVVRGETNRVLSSPGGTIHALLSTGAGGRLTLTILDGDRPVTLASPLGVLVDGGDLGLDVALGMPQRREIREDLVCRGVKSRAVNHCVEYLVPVQSPGGGWVLEVRVFDDGVGFRYRIPGTGTRRIAGESTAWRLEEGCSVWVQNNTANYEGIYYRSTVEAQLAETGDGTKGMGCPVTVERSDGGFALITEACVYGYSGMTLRASDASTLQAVFQDDPNGWEAEGEIVTPWRVTLVCADLNALVNSDLMYSLGEAPDPRLFPQGMDADWIKPGRGLITWAVFNNDGAQWWRQKWFVDMCAALGCEYLLVDGGWRTERWGFLKDGGDLWARLEELCRYAAERNVGIVVWNAYPEGRDDGPGVTDPEERRAFFQKCKDVGVKGVKIDFFDSESKATMEVYERLLRETAELELMINFHGANKPAGEMRTWPHEITREGIREQEYLLWDDLPLPHYGALPFTRMVVGHGDFLPAYVRPQFLKNTTATFQLGTAVIFTSAFICWPDHPEAYLESPMLPMIRSMPAVWDETRVLGGSVIGEVVAMARRSGEDWYVAVLNCREGAASFEVDLSFLGEGEYRALLYRDAEGPLAAQRVESGIAVAADQTLSLDLKPGGGFVGQFVQTVRYTE